MREHVMLVDSNDNTIDYMSKVEAHQKGLLHTALSLFIFNEKEEMGLKKPLVFCFKFLCKAKFHNGLSEHELARSKTLN